MEDLKNFMRAERDGEDGTLYDHLTQVMLRLIVERPENAATYFESISTAERSREADAAGKEAEGAEATEGSEKGAAYGAAVFPLVGGKVQVSRKSMTAATTTTRLPADPLARRPVGPPARRLRRPT